MEISKNQYFRASKVATRFEEEISLLYELLLIYERCLLPSGESGAGYELSTNPEDFKELESKRLEFKKHMSLNIETELKSE